MAELMVALDVASRGEAVEKVKAIGDAVGFYKIGLELFAAEGPDVVKAVRDLGKRVFLDLKFHDIPRTVERAVKSAARLGVNLLTIHASGGRAMVRAAADAAARKAASIMSSFRRRQYLPSFSTTGMKLETPMNSKTKRVAGASMISSSVPTWTMLPFWSRMITRSQSCRAAS